MYKRPMLSTDTKQQYDLQHPKADLISVTGDYVGGRIDVLNRNARWDRLLPQS